MAKSVRQQNGEAVMGALRDINEPSTFTNIVKYVSEVQQVEPNKLKEPVKKVLEKGVEYGFLKKQGAKYSVDSPANLVEELNPDFEDMEDRSGRRRRRTSRSRSRSRSKRRGSRSRSRSRPRRRRR